MAAAFNLKIIACSGMFFDGDIDMLVFPGVDGEVAIMAHHEVMTAEMEIGEIRFHTMDGQWHNAVISSGLITMHPDGSCRIIVYSCERPEDIDKHRAEEALERAKDQMQHKQSIIQYHISAASMARAMARLKSTGGVKYYK